MCKVYVLRLGHRPLRDKRISTHVGLVARAFGASGIYYTNTNDLNLKKSLEKVVKTWGGPFEIHVGGDWKELVKKWKKRGIIVHLTMYGENIEDSDVIARIKQEKKDILVIVGSEKVPAEVYQLADYNVAIGNQPHSEVSALAVFLDRFFEGRELVKEFKDARLKIIPQKRGKKVIRLREREIDK